MLGAEAGSSPLTRGKRGVPDGFPRPIRLIPAHAGKTRTRRGSSRTARAHPRSRGENVIGTFVAGFKTGSSPLTRGKRRRAGGRASGSGLIPAHAGKTKNRVSVGKSRPAHPRSRGENPASSCTPQSGQGSSPLTRGKRGRPSSWTRPAGLIPAHAGKTSGDRRRSRRSPAHPRSRGENHARLHGLAVLDGSSPLTRGKRCSCARRKATAGLIPAHAGKTPRSARRCPPPRAHPRSRGENILARGSAKKWPGSSPLTRGKHRRTPCVARGTGLIPAHAGKTAGSFPAW